MASRVRPQPLRLHFCDGLQLASTQAKPVLAAFCASAEAHCGLGKPSAHAQAPSWAQALSGCFQVAWRLSRARTFLEMAGWLAAVNSQRFCLSQVFLPVKVAQWLACWARNSQVLICRAARVDCAPLSRSREDPRARVAQQPQLRAAVGYTGNVVCNTSFTDLSDSRAKTEIAEADLKKLLQLFEAKQHKRWSDGTKMVTLDYSHLTSALWRVCKGFQARLHAVEAWQAKNPQKWRR